jgi:hypothetical protein
LIFPAIDCNAGALVERPIIESQIFLWFILLLRASIALIAKAPLELLNLKVRSAISANNHEIPLLAMVSERSSAFMNDYE